MKLFLVLIFILALSSIFAQQNVKQYQFGQGQQLDKCLEKCEQEEDYLECEDNCFEDLRNTDGKKKDKNQKQENYFQRLSQVEEEEGFNFLQEEEVLEYEKKIQEFDTKLVEKCSDFVQEAIQKCMMYRQKVCTFVDIEEEYKEIVCLIAKIESLPFTNCLGK